jgi:hypothetical protein
MARPGQIDHVAVGLAQVPEKLRGERIQRYLAVYLAQCNDIEEAVQEIIEAFLTWQTFGEQLDFVLDIIGALFNQPRPDSFDNSQYAFILRARVIVRKSQATRDDVIRVAQFLAQGRPVNVFGLVPKIMIVQFIDLVLTPQEKTLYQQLLLDAIDAVDELAVIYSTAATAGYDIGLYDEDLYAP